MMNFNTHQQFFQQTAALAQELTHIENEVKQQEQRLLSYIDGIITTTRQTAQVQSKKQTAIKAAVDQYFANSLEVLEAWEQRVTSYEAGLSFRERFGDSLLVFVYGKVKAGKSSLGNYIATGKGQPDAAWMQQVAAALHQPHFFTEARNESFKEAINFDEGFQVGTAETTSSIQGFTVPGLTWVDSPGLHSVTSENGDLAQKYVESADLIVYPMNSAHPGRASDMKELESLLRAGKRVLVLITRCDYMDQDIDEDTGAIINSLEMKSDQSRADQIRYVQGELDELCSQHSIVDAQLAVLTISTAYAETHQNSEEAMQKSGVSAFFTMMSDLLSSEGVALKKAAPQRNLQAFYRELMSTDDSVSLLHLRLPLQQALIAVNAQKQELTRLTESTKSRIQNAYTLHMDRLVEETAEKGSSHRLEQQLEAFIYDEVAKQYQQKVITLYQSTLKTLGSIPIQMGLNEKVEIKALHEEIEVDVSGTSRAVGAGVGSLLGGVAGFLVGGPVGAAVGTTLGGMGGGVAGTYFSHTERRTILAGDNREAIKDLLLNKGYESIERTLQTIEANVNQEVFVPIIQAIEMIDQQTQSLQHYIEEQLQHV